MGPFKHCATECYIHPVRNLRLVPVEFAPNASLPCQICVKTSKSRDYFLDPLFRSLPSPSSIRLNVLPRQSTLVAMPPKTPTKKAVVTRAPSPLKTGYLVLYNVASAAAWAYCLGSLLQHLVLDSGVLSSASVPGAVQTLVSSGAGGYAK